MSDSEVRFLGYKSHLLPQAVEKDLASYRGQCGCCQTAADINLLSALPEYFAGLPIRAIAFQGASGKSPRVDSTSVVK